MFTHDLSFLRNIRLVYWLIVHGMNERGNTWHLYRHKKDEINRGRNSYSMLHQRVDDTLGTNRSRTLYRHLLLVLSWNAPLPRRTIPLESMQLHYNIAVSPISLVFE